VALLLRVRVNNFGDFIARVLSVNNRPSFERRFAWQVGHALQWHALGANTTSDSRGTTIVGTVGFTMKTI
jgi:hypothetical protein